MIIRPTKDMVKGIKDIWRICFPQENMAYTDFFFQKMFKPNECWVYEIDDKPVSCLHKIPHAIMLNGRIIRTSMILGIATLPKFQNRGYMHKLMDVCLDSCEHTELVTLIQAYDPKLYEEFGFKTVYYRQVYEFTKDNLDKISVHGCLFNPRVNEMFKVYCSFVKRFNGFYVRDFSDFRRYIQEVKAQNGKICAYYDENNTILGYIVLINDGIKVNVEECIYMNSKALLKLLAIALQQRDIVRLHVSAAENLSWIFKDVTPTRYGFTMARVNDYDLFNRLYQSSVASVEEAFALGNKPLYMSECS